MFPLYKAATANRTKAMPGSLARLFRGEQMRDKPPPSHCLRRLHVTSFVCRPADCGKRSSKFAVSILRHSPEEMARLEGLEPPTYRFEVCRSIQLSYRRVFTNLSVNESGRNSDFHVPGTQGSFMATDVHPACRPTRESASLPVSKSFSCKQLYLGRVQPFKNILWVDRDLFPN
jgi:hypothetical protein